MDIWDAVPAGIMGKGRLRPPMGLGVWTGVWKSKKDGVGAAEAPNAGDMTVCGMTEPDDVTYSCLEVFLRGT